MLPIFGVENSCIVVYTLYFGDPSGSEMLLIYWNVAIEILLEQHEAKQVDAAAPNLLSF